MSKKGKGQKLDAASFFKSSSTNIADMPAVPSRENFDRGQFNGNRSNGDWSRTTRISGPAGNDGAPSDKWDGLFSGGRSSKGFGADTGGGSWRAGVTNKPPQPPSANTVSEVRNNPVAPSIATPAPVTSSANVAVTPAVPIAASVIAANVAADKQKIKSGKSEAARKMKEAKDAIAAKATLAKKAIHSEDNSLLLIAERLVTSGLKGEALLAEIKSLESKPSGSALVTAILSSLEDPLSIKWTGKAEYGTVLQSLLKSEPASQVRSLFAVQAHCHKQNFPKVDVKGNARNLIEIIFQLFYQLDIIEVGAYVSWSDDDVDVKGKTTAVVQTTTFMQFLREDESGDEDDDEDEEIDAPLATVP